MFTDNEGAAGQADWTRQERPIRPITVVASLKVDHQVVGGNREPKVSREEARDGVTGTFYGLSTLGSLLTACLVPTRDGARASHDLMNEERYPRPSNLESRGVRVLLRLR